MRYTQYKDYNGVMFPGLIHVHQGDPRINPGENHFQVTIKDVQPNVVVSKIPVPEVVRTANSTRSRWKRRSSRTMSGCWAAGP
jgi:hypothetical protein